MGTAYNLILRAQSILQDTTGQQWSDADLLREVCAGQTLIAAKVPDGCTGKRPVMLVSGVRQQLPANCISCLAITRNMGTDGLTVGDVIYPFDPASLSAFDPGWEYGTEGTSIKSYFYQPQLPREFMVYPPAVAGIYVEAAMRLEPTPIVYDEAGDWQTSALSINPTYEEALLEFVLFRAYAKDSEDAQNLSRSGAHQQAFQALLGGGQSSQGGSQPPQRGNQ